MIDIFFPFQRLADDVTFKVFNLTPSSYIADALNFFMYDILKIGFLLLVINYFMAVVRYYLPIENIRSILSSRKWYGLDYLLAALLGVITPFCSCSSIPLFIGFVSAGIPLGVTFTFLISSPLVNESSLILFPALFGFKIAFLYNLVGILISIIGGFLIQRLHMERYIDPTFLNIKSASIDKSVHKHKKILVLLKHWWKEGFTISKTIFPYVVLGVALGAFIHGFVPKEFIEHTFLTKGFLSVPLAVLAGIPLYANSVSVIPFVEALVGKGIPLGTALAFMTSTVTLSIPEALMLKKVLKVPLLLTFFSITSVGILCIGFLFNAL